MPVIFGIQTLPGQGPPSRGSRGYPGEAAGFLLPPSLSPSLPKPRVSCSPSQLCSSPPRPRSHPVPCRGAFPASCPRCSASLGFFRDAGMLPVKPRARLKCSVRGSLQILHRPQTRAVRPSRLKGEVRVGKKSSQRVFGEERGLSSPAG